MVWSSKIHLDFFLIKCFSGSRHEIKSMPIVSTFGSIVMLVQSFSYSIWFINNELKSSIKHRVMRVTMNENFVVCA